MKSTHLRTSFIQILLVASFSLSLFAGENRWTIKGPEAGSPSKFVFDPVDSSIVYAAEGDGVFRSSDGGQHWTVAAETLGTPFYDVAVAAGDPEKVFASSVYGLYKSSDRGATWSVVHPFGSFRVATGANGNVVYSISTGGPIRSTDGGVTFGSAGSGFPAATSVSTLAVDPQNSDTVYASLLSAAGVYKSTDGGAHWAPANSGLVKSPIFGQLQCYSLIIDPSNSSTLYVGASGAIFKTTDGGASWTALPIELGEVATYNSLSISAKGSASTIVAGASRGMIKTTTGGSSWSGHLGLGDRATDVVAIDPLNPANMLVSATNTVYRSVNGGTGFTPANSGLTAHYTFAIAIDPKNPSIVYAGGPTGIRKSMDQGETWPVGVGGLYAEYLAVDPFDSQTLYAIVEGYFVRFMNGSPIYQFWHDGLPLDPGPFPSVIAVDPQVPGTLYTIALNAPYKKVGSDPWAVRKTGLPTTGAPTFITIDPHRSSTLYTGGQFGLFKSTNGGDSWAAASSGLTGVSPAGVAVDPFDSNHLLTWSNSSGYESTNGGATWAPFATMAGRQAILLAFDPSTPGRIYNSSADAVERSSDGGKTWLSLSTGLGKSHGNLFIISPSGNSLYAAGTDGGVWVYHFSRSRAAGH